MCNSRDSQPYWRDKRRSYVSCRCCQLVFVPADEHLPAEQERAIYDLHQNQVDDPGYRRFLKRVYQPLTERLPPAAQGLDFGCGPGPALAAMFREAGFAMALYDLYYQPDMAPLRQHYDFITLTEVAEHLASPGIELQRLWGLLRPGGWLAIMTKLVIDRTAFENWHYKNDLTHICFFSRDTFNWLARQWGLSAEFIGSDVILFKKPELQKPYPKGS
ncbi:MAG: class I SAM-dependent methyltransferase [Porticoccaceae bacterium]|nr:class I SAM-dependent methyltransferase [Porticoccaceae bacterium]